MGAGSVLVSPRPSAFLPRPRVRPTSGRVASISAPLGPSRRAAGDRWALDALCLAAGARLGCLPYRSGRLPWAALLFCRVFVSGDRGRGRPLRTVRRSDATRSPSSLAPGSRRSRVRTAGGAIRYSPGRLSSSNLTGTSPCAGGARVVRRWRSHRARIELASMASIPPERAADGVRWSSCGQRRNRQAHRARGVAREPPHGDAASPPGREWS